MHMLMLVSMAPPSCNMSGGHRCQSYIWSGWLRLLLRAKPANQRLWTFLWRSDSYTPPRILDAKEVYSATSMCKWSQIKKATCYIIVLINYRYIIISIISEIINHPFPADAFEAKIWKVRLLHSPWCTLARCLSSFKGLDPRQKPHMSHGFDTALPTSSLPGLLQFSETQWSHVNHRPFGTVLNHSSHEDPAFYISMYMFWMFVKKKEKD